MDVSELLGSILLNPMGIAERVLDEVYSQLSQRNAFGDLDDLPPEDLVATVVGTWVARKFVGDVPAGNPGEDPVPADRNQVVAAALGACPCWGQDPDCRLCAGAGAPGWVMPHRDLFAHYVDPAVKAFTRADTDGRNGNGNAAEAEGTREEFTHV
jgi:hypothetical protein